MAVLIGAPEGRLTERTAEPVDFGELFVQKLLRKLPIRLSRRCSLWGGVRQERVAPYGDSFELCRGLHLTTSGHNRGLASAALQPGTRWPLRGLLAVRDREFTECGCDGPDGGRVFRPRPASPGAGVEAGHP
jgi:hypothetical protein